ncbi:hypothetical protein [Companilactobacillus kimchii]|uniref:Uncharacterized protein n=2 Tax=Companilactobacillus kimchii TaxID=2801452 RepID=A0ABR5NS15_9LACO|nr:hypothetical protein [Companilactobacillus kimchii]KRK50913.1 hypothetical protein FC97_GL001198 [Companilactobacillus kimchii DSM 13961 = JCM 10707]OWF33608.1 hypothetical protein LKACC12383_00748 [Companilactobacillus kimchii]GEO48135.1 hypothetical protein LKI01_21340 [Companilactobacillus paralimentarius]
MILKKTALLVLVSIMLSVIEMTVDPAFILGRVSLVFSGSLMFLLSLLFVRRLWKYTN